MNEAVSARGRRVNACALMAWTTTSQTVVSFVVVHADPRTYASTGKAGFQSRTGKLWENQDTIWHLWRLNDFLLGVGLCPTGKSQKTGRENYIRENVYAAHLAPSLFFFCPANE